ncbi:ABC transporter substrate-binding protein [Georgenia subflava]|uniref:ABC transporter substrate-binding protein n=1 Tax=Georgenia subflava TaxID=1622177 RepID=UPI00186B2D64|nr:sugar ABC transporter substrate-binding protein [Georgenia subflava]
MKSKAALGGLVVSVLALGLTACSGGAGASPGGSATSAGSDENDPVTLVYGMWNVNQEPTFRAMADAFEDEHPNVTVEIELTPVSEYWTKLQTAVQGGSAPDVFWMNHLQLPLYATNGVVTPIDDLIASAGIDTSQYPETSLGLYTFDGAQYGLPQDLDTIGLWYNKDLFDAAGLEYPDADWTWDDVETAAAELTDADNGVFGIASSLDSQSNYYNTIWQAGGEILNEDDTASGWDTEANRAGIEYWTNFIDQGYSPTLAQLSETTADQMFPSGKLAMYYSGTWNVGPYTDDPAIAEMADVAPLPAGEQEAVVVGSLTSVVNAESANPEVAAEFAAFVASETAARIRVEMQDKAPAYGELWREWAASSPFALETLMEESLAASHQLPASLNTAEWTNVELDTLTQIYSGQLDLEDGLTGLKAEVDDILADAK